MCIEFDLKVARKYDSLAHTSKIRGIDFDLPLLSLANLYKAKRCYYTGVELTPKNMSIDRVDNRLGYVKGNVVACDKTVNSLKGSIEPDLLRLLSRKVDKHISP